MAMTSIEWARGDDGSLGRVWNPVTGCTKVSPGCKNCYAEGVAERFWRGRSFTDVICHPERLDAPLRWRQPSRVFVNSMSDLFHEDVPDHFLGSVWNIMCAASKHSFQVLTKRPDRMRQFVLSQRGYSQVLGQAREYYPYDPPRNIWLGVSVENQETADERIPILIQTPAAIRFLSMEPLLEPVDLGSWFWSAMTDSRKCAIDWVIIGGESGPEARLCDIDWIRYVATQVRSAGISVFIKQLGANAQLGTLRYRTVDRKGGDICWFPEDLRIREYPASRRR